MLVVLLLIAAAVCAGAAAFGVTAGRVNLLALAVLFYLLAVLIPALHAV
jgi:hypothetical protein